MGWEVSWVLGKIQTQPEFYGCPCIFTIKKKLIRD